MKPKIFIGSSIERYKNLIYSMGTSVVGISILIQNDSKYFGWCILSISFGYLVIFLGYLVETKKLKTTLNILSIAVPGLFMIYGLLSILLHLLAGAGLRPVPLAGADLLSAPARFYKCYQIE